jgi:hypothetical protein
MATTTINLGLSLDGLSNVDSTGKATGDVLEWNAVTSKWEAATPSGGGASGICGIPNSSGVYTYYSTLGAAITAASAGQTIEVFTNITETGNVQINLKNGVNINFNGHTYTLNNAGTANAFSDNNVAVTCKLMNGTINRIGGALSYTNQCTLFVQNASTTVRSEGMSFLCTGGLACRPSGTIIGGYFQSNVEAVDQSGGTIIGIEALSTGGTGVVANAVISDSVARGSIRGFTFQSGCTANNCTGITTAASSSGIFVNGSRINNCVGSSSGGWGIFVNAGTSAVLNNCTGFSSVFNGIAAGSGTLNNCTGQSTGDRGISLNPAAEAYNCTAFSSVNNGMIQNAGAKIAECTIISTAAAGLNSQGQVYNCTVISRWNNAAGHAITSATPYTEVFNCHLEVTNASANCLHYGSAISVRFGANTFKGATTPVNANITQTQANAPDTYGNILIS